MSSQGFLLGFDGQQKENKLVLLGARNSHTASHLISIQLLSEVAIVAVYPVEETEALSGMVLYLWDPADLALDTRTPNPVLLSPLYSMHRCKLISSGAYNTLVYW